MVSTSHPHIIKQASKPFAYTTVQRKNQTVFNKPERRPQEHY
jgi:hypothetical protein